MNSLLNFITIDNLYLAHIANWGTLLLMIYGIRIHEKFTFAQILVLIYICLSVFIDLVINQQMTYYFKTNLETINIFGILEFVNLSFFFHHIIDSRRIKFIIKSVSVPILIFATCNFFFLEGPSVLNKLTLLLTFSTIILLILLYLIQIVKQIENIRIEHVAPFWFSSGFLVFFSANFFLLNLYGIVNLNINYNWIFYPSRIVMNCFIIYGFICQQKKLLDTQ